MKGQVNFTGSLSESLPIDNGFKQSDMAASTLFPILFAVALTHAFPDYKVDVYPRIRITGKVFNLTHPKAKPKI